MTVNLFVDDAYTLRSNLQNRRQKESRERRRKSFNNRLTFPKLWCKLTECFSLPAEVDDCPLPQRTMTLSQYLLYCANYKRSYNQV